MVPAVTLYLMLNNQFVGDEQQVKAVGAQIVERFEGRSAKFRTIEYPDNSGETPTALEKDLTTSQAARSIILVSGSHGFQFITQFMDRKEVQELFRQNPAKKPIVVWVGHQDPGLIKQADLFDLIALPKHIVEDSAALSGKFETRLIAMEAVPNTLQEKDLAQALDIME